MAKKKVEFEIKVVGNAQDELKQITGRTNALGQAAGLAKSKMLSLGQGFVGLNQAMELFQKITRQLHEFSEAYQAQAEAEGKLERVMRNTMRARVEEIQSIKNLASAQQRLGVIGDEVQLAGAQELGTYLSKADSLKKLMPVMNDMLAQQYGLNASQEQAVQIASMMGKVMDGQVGALSRYGYKFDEAQEKLLKFGTEEQRVATLAEVITQSVGGMNRALAKTDVGKLRKIKDRFGDIKESIGGIATSISARLVPIGNWALDKAEKLLGTGNTAIRQIAEEKSELNTLVESLIDVYDKEDERKRLIDEIQRKYPDFLKNIDLEKDGVDGLRKKLVEVNAEYDKRIRNAVIAHRLEKLQQESEEAYDDYLAILLSRNARSRNKELMGQMGIPNELDSKFIKKDANGYYVTERYYDPAYKGVRTRKNYKPSITDELWEEFQANQRYYVRDGDKRFARKSDNFNKIKAEMSVLENLSGGGTSEGNTGGGSTGTELETETQNTIAGGATAAVTGGTRNTTVNINLGKMVENIVFNGTLGENAQELENRIQEILTRTLTMAAATA